MTSRMITADVEVSLSEFDTEELIEELDSRRVDYEYFFDPEKVYELFSLGKDEQAIDECKKMIERTTGRILP